MRGREEEEERGRGGERKRRGEGEGERDGRFGRTEEPGKGGRKEVFYDVLKCNHQHNVRSPITALYC